MLEPPSEPLINKPFFPMRVKNACLNSGDSKYSLSCTSFAPVVPNFSCINQPIVGEYKPFSDSDQRVPSGLITFVILSIVLLRVSATSVIGLFGSTY